MRERTPFPADLIARLGNLKLVLTTGSRNAALDLGALKERGIPVAGAPMLAGHGTGGQEGPAAPDSTTQHCVAMILAADRHIAQDDLAVKSGGWQTSSAMGLAGAVFGTIGLGRLGVAVAKI